jgi:NAD(P)-dependent dehydrogenase (short-subunit alcohol dehydrogenase family)
MSTATPTTTTTTTPPAAPRPAAGAPLPEPLLAEVPSFDLNGRTALVTGSSRGIGRSIALALAAAGADVAITCNTGGAVAEEVRELIAGLGRKAKVYAHDIAEEAGAEAMCAEVLRDFGQVDVLVNNAGITRDRSFKKLTKAAWDEVITTDLTSVFLVTKQLIDPMAERGWGRVINMSSIVGEIGNFGQANYAAAKAGLIGLTKTLAREYARKGVTVNAVAPGFVKTRMTQDIPEKGLEAVLALTPVGRMGEPSEIAAGVLFLASPAAGFITGAVLDINGGMAM